MPPVSEKNQMISPAASDLGLGDALNQQLQDEEDERKKKLLQQGRSALPSMFGDSTISPASMQLFGGTK